MKGLGGAKFGTHSLFVNIGELNFFCMTYFAMQILSQILYRCDNWTMSQGLIFQVVTIIIRKVPEIRITFPRLKVSCLII
jgi:hypothetical protein